VVSPTRLCARGHACVVAVPARRETLSAIPGPLFIPATFAEALAQPALFPTAAPPMSSTPGRRAKAAASSCGLQRGPGPPRVSSCIWRTTRNSSSSVSRQTLAELRSAARRSSPPPWWTDCRTPGGTRIFCGSPTAVTVIVPSLKQLCRRNERSRCCRGRRFHPYHIRRPPTPPCTSSSACASRRNHRSHRRHHFCQRGRVPRFLPGRLTAQPARGHRPGSCAPGSPPRLQPPAWALTPSPSSWTGFVDKHLLPRLLALADVLVQPGRAGPFTTNRLPSKLRGIFASGRPVILPATKHCRADEGRARGTLPPDCTPEEIVGLCLRVFADLRSPRNSARRRAFARKHFDLAANTTALGELLRGDAAAAGPGDWSALRSGAISEISLLPQVLHHQVGKLPAGSLRGAGGPAGSPRQQLAHFERAGRGLGLAPAALAGPPWPTRRTAWRSPRSRFDPGKGLELTKQHADNLGKDRGRCPRPAEAAEERYAISESCWPPPATSSRRSTPTSPYPPAREPTWKVARRQRAASASLDEHLASPREIRRDAKPKIRAMQPASRGRPRRRSAGCGSQLVDPWRKRPRRGRRPGRPVPSRHRSAFRPGRKRRRQRPCANPTPASPSAQRGLSAELEPSRPPDHAARLVASPDDGRKLKAVRAVLPDRTVEGTYASSASTFWPRCAPSPGRILG